VNRFAFRLVSVAFEALGRVSVFVEGDWMNLGRGAESEHRDHSHPGPHPDSAIAAAAEANHFADPDAIKQQFHSTTNSAC
jgi:hypothetical protein